MTISSQREFHVVIEKGEDNYYVASVVELPRCHTQAKKIEQLDGRIREAIELYLKAEGDRLTLPEFVALKKVKL